MKDYVMSNLTPEGWVVVQKSTSKNETIIFVARKAVFANFD